MKLNTQLFLVIVLATIIEVYGGCDKNGCDAPATVSSSAEGVYQNVQFISVAENQYQNFNGMQYVLMREATAPAYYQNAVGNSPVYYQAVTNPNYLSAPYQNIQNFAAPTQTVETPQYSTFVKQKVIAEPTKFVVPIQKPVVAYKVIQPIIYGPPPTTTTTEPPVEVAPAIGNTDPVKNKNYAVKTVVHDFEDGGPRSTIYSGSHTIRGTRK
ncbi:hypothetical protein Ocin01_16814 [Orchesella cincta]|uniref:Uncharacterized protein n=1 Tax=Orchesella cincta TaxID=48709 RepID=A0A1D2MAB3_ORCCI|nr:hypothetical protein Ocin01_16814 [Orchesella cincta]